MLGGTICGHLPDFMGDSLQEKRLKFKHNIKQSKLRSKRSMKGDGVSPCDIFWSMDLAMPAVSYSICKFLCHLLKLI